MAENYTTEEQTLIEQMAKSAVISESIGISEQTLVEELGKLPDVGQAAEMARDLTLYLLRKETTLSIVEITNLTGSTLAAIRRAVGMIDAKRNTCAIFGEYVERVMAKARETWQNRERRNSLRRIVEIVQFVYESDKDSLRVLMMDLDNDEALRRTSADDAAMVLAYEHTQLTIPEIAKYYKVSPREIVSVLLRRDIIRQYYRFSLAELEVRKVGRQEGWACSDTP